jgi:hypothetical protein
MTPLSWQYTWVEGDAWILPPCDSISAVNLHYISCPSLRTLNRDGFVKTSLSSDSNLTILSSKSSLTKAATTSTFALEKAQNQNSILRIIVIREFSAHETVAGGVVIVIVETIVN